MTHDFALDDLFLDHNRFGRIVPLDCDSFFCRPFCHAMLSARTAALWGTAMLLMMTLSGCGTSLIDRIQQPRWGLCGTLVIILDIVALD